MLKSMLKAGHIFQHTLCDVRNCYQMVVPSPSLSADGQLLEAVRDNGPFGDSSHISSNGRVPDAHIKDVVFMCRNSLDNPDLKRIGRNRIFVLYQPMIGIL